MAATYELREMFTVRKVRARAIGRWLQSPAPTRVTAVGELKTAFS